MSDLKKLKDGSVKELQPEVVTRCAFCGKANPVIEVREAGRSDNQILAAMVLTCCKRILNCQILEKAPETPIIN
jgi:hypothetical protein